MKKYTLKLVRAGITAALYVALTMSFGPLAFGPIQIRPSEALCILPLFMPETIPGLFIGCALSNLISGYGIYDIVFGSITTLLAAMLTFICGRIFKNNLLKFVTGAFPPVILNALAVPLIIVIVDGNYALYWGYVLSMFLTQSIWIYGLGSQLYIGLNRINMETMKIKPRIIKARKKDLKKVVDLYKDVLNSLEQNINYPCWDKDYPSESTAINAIEDEALFIYVDKNRVKACYTLDHSCLGNYGKVNWSKVLKEGEYFVMHSLCVSPDCRGEGIARQMVEYIKTYSCRHGKGLRLDATSINLPAIKLYTSCGLNEVGTYDLERNLEKVKMFTLFEYYG